MVPPPWHRGTCQSSNTLQDSSMPLKLKNIIVFTIYFLFKGAAHRRRTATQTPNFHHSPLPLLASINHPCFLRPPISTYEVMCVATMAMHGGTVIVCIGDTFVRRCSLFDAPTPRRSTQQMQSSPHPPITSIAKLIVTSIPSRFDSWDAWSQLALMMHPYAGAPHSKMKNCAIWSNTVVEDTGMMVSTGQFWHICS
jgi:hypothetical protein